MIPVDQLEAIRDSTGSMMLPREAIRASEKYLAEQLLESYERERQLAEALKLAAGVRHDMDGHHSIYTECKIGGCVRERAALAEHAG